MKQKVIENLISNYPDLKLYKVSSDDFILLDSTSTEEVFRGARITKSRFSITLSIWLTPLLCLSSSDVIVFDNYQMVTGQGQQELSLNKDLFDEDALLSKFKDALSYSLPVLKTVNRLEELRDFLSSNEEQWLVSAFSKAQYALLIFYTGQKMQAIDLLNSIYTYLNSHNPLTKEVKKFIELIELDDSEKLDDYFNYLISSNGSRLRKQFAIER